MTLKEHFLSSFERFRERIAFNQPFFENGSLRWRSFTYEDVKDIAFRFFELLMKETSHGSPVLLYAENSVYWCAAYIGIILRGAVAVPVDVEVDGETLQNIINDASPSFILYSKKTASQVKGYKGFDIERIDELTLLPESRPFEPSEDTIASIIYTSGTTGRPKAVMLTHGNFSFEIEAGKKTGIIKEDENVLCILPLHHTYPFVCNFLVPFCLGATITFSPFLRGPEVIKTIKDKRITALIAVPQVLEIMRLRIMERFKNLPFFVRPLISGSIRLTSFLRRRFHLNAGRCLFFFLHMRTGTQFRFFASGGARLDPQVMKDLEALGFTVIEGYGLTETSPVATFNPVNRRKPGSAGRPLEGVELKIINPDHTGAGEIAIRGPLVMKGYYKNEELTRESIRDGWFLTGDLGYIDRDGYLFITGRKKDVIVLPSGKTIYPEDVEDRYRKAIPLIKEICLLDTMEAVIVPDIERAKKEGIVNIQSNLKWQIDSLSKELPSYMRIKGLILHNEPLPKTRLGKFKRFMVREILQKKKPYDGPPDQWLQSDRGKIIQEVLYTILPSLKNIRSTDHLELDLGMDSLKRLEFAASLESRLSINITDDLLSRWHTVRDVLEDLERLTSFKGHRRVSSIHRDPAFRFLNYLILRSAHTILRLIFRLFFRLEVSGIDNLPSPPFIITPNHTSFLDGFVIFAGLPFRISRKLHFHGLKKYFPSWRISQFINVISISSDRDLISAMEHSKELLKKGYPLCIFPEGGRSFDGELREFKTGFALLSIEQKVPVVPVFIDGTFQSLPRGRLIPVPHRIRVFIDRPLYPSVDNAESLRDKLRERLLILKSSISSLS